MDFFQDSPSTGTPPLLTENATDWRTNVPTVSQLTRRLRGHLENTFFDVWVRGEISNFRKPSSGHAYLILKDAGAQLRACFFRPVLSRLKFQIEDGMEVLVHGRVTVYEPRGEYQIIADAVEPVGTGALQLAFEQLKARLLAEGLFAAETKKPLPLLPARIGIVTSSTGAALRDILKVLSRRFAEREIFIFHASVQGDRAAPEICAALKQVEVWNTQSPERAIEVLIVGRGGGSLEDLWPFNEENVARAIFACPIPVLSAVGHETDFTIADFVADVRAPTPSAAAELVLPKKEDLVSQIEALQRHLRAVFFGKLEQWKLHLTHLGRRLIGPEQRLAKTKMELQACLDRLQRAMRNRMELQRSHLQRATGTLNALSPLQILSRGFTLTRDTDGKIIRSALGTRPGQVLSTLFHDGEVRSEVLPTPPNRG